MQEALVVEGPIAGVETLQQFFPRPHTKINRVQRREEPSVEPLVPAAPIGINAVLYAPPDTGLGHEVTKDAVVDLGLGR